MFSAANASGVVATERVDGRATEVGRGSTLRLMVSSLVDRVGGSMLGLPTGGTACTLVDPSTFPDGSREEELPALGELPA